MKSRGADVAHGASDVWMTWEPGVDIELDLHNWQPQGYNPAEHLFFHSGSQRSLSYSGVELKAIQLMNEPMEFELPAMLAYMSFS